MQWKNWNEYQEFTDTHPELARCVEQQLSSLRTNGQSTQDIVERNLAYIAIRSWEYLSLEWTGAWRAYDQTTVHVAYAVYAHIEGEDRPCARACISYSPNGSTIRGLINQLKEWHQIYWAKQDDRPIVFDAVTRTSSFVHHEKSIHTPSKKAISFYLFPKGFNA